MDNIYTISVKGNKVTFDMEKYSETIEMALSITNSYAFNDDDDYRLLRDFKLAKYVHHSQFIKGDPIFEQYKDRYFDLLQKVNDRFNQ